MATDDQLEQLPDGPRAALVRVSDARSAGGIPVLAAPPDAGAVLAALLADLAPRTRKTYGRRTPST